MLMREGEGEGALEEMALETREEEAVEGCAEASQFCSSSRSSSLEGPPRELSAK